MGESATDLANLIEPHGIVHRQPASVWEDGLYLGNGDLAAMVFGTGQRTRVLLNKGDIWDERSDQVLPMEAFWDWKTMKAAIARGVETGDWSDYTAASEAPRPSGHSSLFATYQPAGYLEVLGDLPVDIGFQQRLSIYEAMVSCSYSGEEGEFRLRTYTHARHNLLRLEMETPAPDLWPRKLTLHRQLTPFLDDWQADSQISPPEFGSDGNSAWMTQVFPDGFAYAVVLEISGDSVKMACEGAEVSALLEGGGETVRCHLTIQTGQGVAAEDLVAQGRRQLAKIVESGDLDATHTQWWADFWRQGWISLPDKTVENLWYTEIYKVASCSRPGGQAPGQLGHWSGYPDPPWRGDYHTNINVQQNFWPVYTANRLELGAPLYEMYLGMLDQVVEETSRSGMPGARYPRGHGKNGVSNSPGSLNWGIWPGSGPWICAHFWWHFEMTRDEAFLRECYPMFTECLAFFLAYVGEPDSAGRYNVVPSLSHEIAHDQATAPSGRTWGRNSTYDLALLREHLRNTIAASQALDADAAEREHWQQVLDRVAPYPVSETGRLMEWEGIELSASHRHLSHLYPVFPGEEIHQGSPREWVKIGKQSVLRAVERGFEGYCGFSFPWLACALARMGEGDTAVEMINNHLRAFVNVNGFSGIFDTKVPGLGDYARGKPKQEGRWLPNMESGSGLGAAIGELLMHSPGGTIRVFPAIPEAWPDAAFSTLRAQGAFLVSAQRRGGRTDWIRLESLAGVECRLAEPWPQEGSIVFAEDGLPHAHTVADGVIAFATQSGRSYRVCPTGFAASSAGTPAPVIAEDEEPYRLGIGGSFSRQYPDQNPWRS